MAALALALLPGVGTASSPVDVELLLVVTG